MVPDLWGHIRMRTMSHASWKFMHHKNDMRDTYAFYMCNHVTMSIRQPNTE